MSEPKYPGLKYHTDAIHISAAARATLAARYSPVRPHDFRQHYAGDAASAIGFYNEMGLLGGVLTYQQCRKVSDQINGHTGAAGADFTQEHVLYG